MYELTTRPGRAARGEGFQVPGRAAVGLMVVLCAAACGDDGGSGETAPACLDLATESCMPSWEPTYDEIFDRVLLRSCGASTTGGACHYEEAPAGSLYLFERDAAYNALVNGHAGGAATVVPGDAACSPLMQRLESDEPGFRMPLGGSKLDDGVRCAVARWIDAGALQTEE